MTDRLCSAIHPDYWLCTSLEGHSGPHEARGTSDVLATWDNDNDAEQDANDFPEGSTEWHAWGLGHTYGQTHDVTDEPLSGEWADGPSPADVISAAWQAVMGPSWDTYADGSDDDRDDDTGILDAWEAGARHAWRNR